MSEVANSTIIFVLNLLNNLQLPLLEFLKLCLTNAEFSQHSVIQSLLHHPEEFLEILQNQPSASKKVLNWIDGRVQEDYSEELTSLTREETSLQFSAVNATAEELETYQIDTLKHKMILHTPRLWQLIQKLQCSDPIVNDRREKRWRKKEEILAFEPEAPDEKLYNDDDNEPEDNSTNDPSEKASRDFNTADKRLRRECTA